MADPTVQDRVRRHLSAQSTGHGRQRAPAAGRHLEFVLKTINAPRPHPIDGPTLVQCLLGGSLRPEWRPHIEAFFDEVSVEAIHDLVLAGVVDFEDLHRAARTWKVTDGRAVPWIKEMADLSLAVPAP